MSIQNSLWKIFIKLENIATNNKLTKNWWNVSPNKNDIVQQFMRLKDDIMGNIWMKNWSMKGQKFPRNSSEFQVRMS